MSSRSTRTFTQSSRRPIMKLQIGVMDAVSAPVAARRARPRSTASATASAWETVKTTVPLALTPADMPIDLVLHTPGGLVLASDQIAYALKRHPGRVTVIVPHYAMSGGTLVALAADEILMDPDAVLGPVDPQLGNPLRGAWPAASILAALEQPNPNRDDETLILGDIARKAIVQVRETVVDLVRDRMPAEAETLATTLSEGRWTHDYPIRREQAGELGLPVGDAVPEGVYELMDRYPRRAQRRPSVEFIPTPYREPGQDR